MIGGSLRICHSEFHQDTDFDEMSVERNVRLGVDSSSDPCGIARFDGVVGFARATVGNNFDASQALFRGAMTEFDGMRVTKHAKFGTVGTGANDPAVSLQALHFSLGDMTYGDIQFPGLRRSNEWEKERAILELVQRSKYSSEAYRNLEAYYRRAFPALANEAFVAGQRRYRMTYLGCAWRNLCVPFTLNFIFLDKIIGYGRHTELVLGISLVLIVAAWGVFFPSRAAVEAQDEKDKDKFYHGFWYSMDLFVPGIDLGMRNRWQPRGHPARVYAFIHRTIGWVLIPLAAAYLLGLVK